MKYRTVINVISFLLLFEGIALCVATAVGFIMDDPSFVTRAVAFCAGVSCLAGFIGYVATERRQGEIDYNIAGTKAGFTTVALGWLVTTAVAALPFVFGASMHFSDAFFETASGLTTTGASVISTSLPVRGGIRLGEFYSNLHACYPQENLPLPYTLLMWRALLNWLGGCGIVFFVLLVLPNMGGNTLLYNAEVPGIKTDDDQLTPRLRDSILQVSTIYVVLTLACCATYVFYGMTPFDALCHAFSTVSTGGFSPKSASLGFYPRAGLQWAAIFFMFISACNFSLILKVFLRHKLAFLHDEEFRHFLFYVAGATLFITVLVYHNCPQGLPVTGRDRLLPRAIEPYLRTVALQIVSLCSTTGFISSNYEAWHSPSALMIILLLMIPCGCGGSTAGGLKISRVIVLFKHLANEIRHCVYPRLLPDVRLSGARLPQETVNKTLAFAMLYLVILLGTAFLLLFVEPNLSIRTAIGTALTAISNVGPGLGPSGPSGDFGFFSPFSKYLLSLIMITGRLELYTILVIFLPSFWKK